MNRSYCHIRWTAINSWNFFVMTCLFFLKICLKGAITDVDFPRWCTATFSCGSLRLGTSARDTLDRTGWTNWLASAVPRSKSAGLIFWEYLKNRVYYTEIKNIYELREGITTAAFRNNINVDYFMVLIQIGKKGDHMFIYFVTTTLSINLLFIFFIIRAVHGREIIWKLRQITIANFLISMCNA